MKSPCTWCCGLAAIVIGVLIAMIARTPQLDTSAPLGSGSMFDSIAGHYDVVNKFLSLGMDMRWRQTLLDELQLQKGDRVLDLATGTADVAIMVGDALRTLSGASSSIEGKVVGIDPSANMLAKGKEKVAAKHLSQVVTLQLGDAQQLKDIPDASFDKVTMSFGIRNVPDRAAALREMRRVAAPGATLAIMDLHAPAQGPLAAVARTAIKLLPTLAGFFSRTPEQYSHLANSIFNFPSSEQWQQIMSAEGLPVFKAVPMCFGAVMLYLAHPSPEQTSDESVTAGAIEAS